MSRIEEINKRKTFGIIAHPDAGKTTLTEKLLLFGGAIQEAGAVKSNKIKKSTTVIMFHLDAPSGHGGHVIIHKKHPTTRDKKLAKVIKKYVGLNPAYHGYSYRTNLRNCNVLRRRGIDYSLVESGFITNKSDYKHFNKNIDKIAKGYVEAIANEKIK